MPSGRQTTNYLDLILPKGSEYYSVQDGNLNFTILDSKIEEIVNNISSLNDNMESSIEQAVSDIIGGSTEGIDSLKDILDLLNDPESGELVKINEAINQRVTNDEFSEFKTEHTKVHDTLNTRLSNIDDGSNGLIVKEQTARQSADIELTNKISSKADKKNDNGGFAGGYNASATNGGAIGDNAFEDEGGFAGGYRASATDGGGAIGDNVNAIAGGGAVGSGAHTNNGGFAGGANASAGAGGAVGYGASENNGGFAGGANASATSGGAVGANADATTGGAIGISAFTTSGGAVGCFTKTEKGFAGGYNAQTINGDDPIDAIQLGTGTNSIEKTLQVYNYQLMDVNGYICKDRLISGDGGFAGGADASAISGGAVGLNATANTGGAVGANADATTGGAVGSLAYATIGGAVGYAASENNGGFAGGANASATNGGGAVGYESSATSGGGAVGANADAFAGGAVGHSADASSGGAVGYEASANNGGAVGEGANTYDGGAIGVGSYSLSGGAVGWFTETGNGFAGGYNAQTINGDDPIDAIQLGTGTNSIEKTLQVYNYQLMDASGNVPSARLTQAVNSAGSDYAEMLEWSDGNLNNEDRRGLFIAYDDSNPDKIKIANKDDEIIGVTSSIPTVIGNSCNDNWKCKYKTDVFGKPLTQIVHHDAEYIEIDVKDIDENGNKLKTTHKEQKLIHSEYDSEEYIINPKYDSAQEYIPRLKRKEWAVIGMIGQLIMIDDGTCIPGKKCVCGENGIATLSENNSGFRVLSRIDDTHIKVFIK